eukprot:1140045-Pelagomonas_calceolata.AAC.2
MFCQFEACSPCVDLPISGWTTVSGRTRASLGTGYACAICQRETPEANKALSRIRPTVLYRIYRAVATLRKAPLLEHFHKISLRKGLNKGHTSNKG